MPDVSVNTEKLLAGLKEYFETEAMKNLIQEIFHGPFKISKISKVVAMVHEAVIKVEQLAADLTDLQTPATGREKKQAIVKWADESLNLPFYLEWADGPAIAMAIDAIVAFYNVKIGHKWLDVVKKIF